MFIQEELLTRHNLASHCFGVSVKKIGIKIVFIFITAFADILLKSLVSNNFVLIESRDIGLTVQMVDLLHVQLENANL